MDFLIKSGRLVDPASKVDAVTDILVSEGKIKSVRPRLSPSSSKMPILNAKGLIVFPGLIDMHAHLRDPGDPEEENIASGTRAAAKGGFTSVCCMANTHPPLDTPSMIEYVVSKAKKEGMVKVHPIGAVTLGLKGKMMTEMGRMIEEGAVAFSDDGHPVLDSGILRLALEYLRQFDLPIISHCEDPGLSGGGQMNEGYFSTIWGLKGIPTLAEELMVSRDIALAKEYGRVHIAHISSAGSVELIRRAKQAGLPVTCETCPHYFTLTEEEIEGYNTSAKVNPPLRSEKDLEAVIEGLKDGTIDVISTDHAPHKEEKKKVEFGSAANGMVGLETALPLVLTELVATGVLSLGQAIEKMTAAPARILKLKAGSLKIGSDADLCIIDPKKEFRVDPAQFASRSRNTPFAGMQLKGEVLYTVIEGRVVVKEGQLIG